MKKLVVLALVFLMSVVAWPGSRTAKAQATPPNVVIIMSDDQRWDTATPAYMPHLNADLAANGVTFDNAFVPNSLCCPSRTTTLTGNYSHDTGVFGNNGEWGGYDAFMNHGTNSTNNIATDFKSAGYETALVGKYLNNYPQADNYTLIPSYWDKWFVVPTGSYYDYSADDNGAMVPYGSRPSDYIGRVLTAQASSFISQSQVDGKPFFLYLTPTAPHKALPGPPIPDPQDVGRFTEPFQAPPSWGGFDGDVLRTKPTYVRDTWWDLTKEAPISKLELNTLDSVHSVDRIVGAIWNEVPPNTIVLFMSDNGFLWGEHRRLGKEVPYNEAIRIPMVLAYKGAGGPLTPGVEHQIVLNADVRTTLEHLAGVTVSEPVDGLDMLRTDRQTFVLEHSQPLLYTDVPEYCGVRSGAWMYVKYGGTTGDAGFEELYNEATDPYELRNLVKEKGARVELGRMRAKARIRCTAGAYHPNGWPFP